MEYSTSLCPIPDEQQPLNEYQTLLGSWFYSWAVRSVFGYVKPFVILWLLSWLIVGPVAATSFPMSKYPVHFALSGMVGALLIPVLVLIRLYLGWVYVRDRLNREIVSYEESGWYDGQTWAKPPEILQRDRLIVSYEIKPILERLHRTFAVVALVLMVEVIVWALL
ncbi:MAG: CGLD27 family protein [Synechococcales cyanobacterium T60_A2020_003]|nr:CGLD27 family protein [Synechococcales cyanobacterium T60_A2020_003]